MTNTTNTLSNKCKICDSYISSFGNWVWNENTKKDMWVCSFCKWDLQDLITEYERGLR